MPATSTMITNNEGDNSFISKAGGNSAAANFSGAAYTNGAGNQSNDQGNGTMNNLKSQKTLNGDFKGQLLKTLQLKKFNWSQSKFYAEFFAYLVRISTCFSLLNKCIVD